MQDLVWQRPNVAPRLAQLLDLRGGHEFLHPDEERKSSKTKPVQKPTLTITQRANQTAADDDDGGDRSCSCGCHGVDGNGDHYDDDADDPNDDVVCDRYDVDDDEEDDDEYVDDDDDDYGGVSDYR